MLPCCEGPLKHSLSWADSNALTIAMLSVCLGWHTLMPTGNNLRCIYHAGEPRPMDSCTRPWHGSRSAMPQILGGNSPPNRRLWRCRLKSPGAGGPRAVCCNSLYLRYFLVILVPE